MSFSFGSGFGGVTCRGTGGKLVDTKVGDRSMKLCQKDNLYYGSCADCGMLKQGETEYSPKYSVGDQKGLNTVTQILSTLKFL